MSDRDMSVQDTQEEHVAFYKKRLFWCVIFFIAVCAIGVSAVRSDAAKADAKEGSRYFVSRSTAVSATDETVRTSGEGIITTSETETTAVNTDSTSGEVVPAIGFPGATDNKIETETSESDGGKEDTNGFTVYVTPTGKRYHLRKSCAGKNAIETKFSSAKKKYTPCKKCAGG